MAVASIAVSAMAVAACGRETARPSAASEYVLPPRATVQFPVGWRYAAGAHASTAPHSMIVSNSRLASAAGLEILDRGGNAVDAAVAVGFALAVTHPEAGNIGGGGYMVIRMADGREGALDYREVAPRAATRDMYAPARGAASNASLVGHLASGVPGSVAGMAEALRTMGTMSLHDVMQPAIRLAEDGFDVDSAFVHSLTEERARIEPFAGASLWLPGGAPLTIGTRVQQPDLARTLRLIADQGPSAFYLGAIGDSLVGEMRRGGGRITKEDLAAYRPAWREPVRVAYRGYWLLSMPPSSSGGTTIAETLNLLEGRDTLPPHGTTAWAHALGSAYQLAFLDRNAKIGDPDFVTVPVGELTSKEYARTLRMRVAGDHAVPTTTLMRASASGGTAAGRTGGAPASLVPEGANTTHYSVVDQFGNAVATTTTINDLYGSGVVVRGAGFFLNDEMDDFTTQPGKPNLYGLIQGEQNAIQPGKRMLSAMSPSIVLDPSGNVLMVLGSRGGPRIITSTSQVILNVLDLRMTLADALSAPRIHHQALPDTLRYEPGGLTSAVMDSLRARGYALGTLPVIGQVMAILRVAGGWEGMVDPRSTGGALGH
jgi:gamma-glutamyltranspeptidase/glutathione hydrolase